MLKAKLAFAAMLFLCSASSAFGAGTPEVEKYVIKSRPEMNVRYSGKFRQSFKEGFETGVGSGLDFLGMDRDSGLLFVSISDRGPNADSSGVEAEGKTTPSKNSPAPDFVPRFATLKFKDGKVWVSEMKPLLDSSGKKISGRPLPGGSVGSTNEIPLADDLTKLSTDPDWTRRASTLTRKTAATGSATNMARS